MGTFVGIMIQGGLSLEGATAVARPLRFYSGAHPPPLTRRACWLPFAEASALSSSDDSIVQFSDELSCGGFLVNRKR